MSLASRHSNVIYGGENILFDTLFDTVKISTHNKPLEFSCKIKLLDIAGNKLLGTDTNGNIISTTSFYDKTEVDSKISNIDIDNYYDKKEIDGKIGSSDFSKYYDKTEVRTWVEDNIVTHLKDKAGVSIGTSKQWSFSPEQIKITDAGSGEADIIFKAGGDRYQVGCNSYGFWTYNSSGYGIVHMDGKNKIGIAGIVKPEYELDVNGALGLVSKEHNATLVDFNCAWRGGLDRAYIKIGNEIKLNNGKTINKELVPYNDNNTDYLIIHKEGGGIAINHDIVCIFADATRAIGSVSKIVMFKKDKDKNELAYISSAGSLITSSDVRLKEYINPIENSLDKVLKLNPVKYKRDGNNEIGLIAQEVEKVGLEHIVFTENTTEKMKSIDYIKLNVYLIKAVQELNAKINEQNEIINKQNEKTNEQNEIINNLITNQRILNKKINALALLH